MTFLDIVVVPVRKADLDNYLEHSRTMAPFFKDNGAIRVTETWGVDLPGAPFGFAGALALSADETVAIGWIIWPDRACRDAAWARLEQENPTGDAPPPFDRTRMLYGGFALKADG